MTTATQIPCCLICRAALEVRPSRGRKSGKPSLMVICPIDGRHFRGFINDQAYVNDVLARLEGHTPSLEARVDVDANCTPDTRSRTILERLGD